MNNNENLINLNILNGMDGFSILMPEIFLLFSVLFLIPLNLYFFKDKRFKNSNKFSIFSIIVTFILVIMNPHEGHGFNNLIFSSNYQQFVKCLILISILFILIITKNKSKIEGINYSEFNILILLSSCGMLFVVSSNNLMTLYLAIELQALPIYILCCLRRNDIKSSEAGLKYFLLGALSSGFLLFGISLVYGFAGTVNFDEVLASNISSNVGLSFGLVFMLSGIAFKISAAPFHMWAPDVYQGSPTPITLLIASSPKITVVSIMMVLTYKVFRDFNDKWTDLIIVLSLCSMTIGSIGAIIQSNLKRLLAYSGIAHMGFILVGLVSFSNSGLEAVLFYLMVYLFLLVGVFSIILSLNKDGQPIELLSDLKGLSNHHPLLSISLLVFMFSMAGIPPLSGFFGKWFVFYAAVEKGLYFLAIIGVIFSVISAFYYLKIVKIMYFEISDDPLLLDQSFDLKLVMLICLIFTSLIFLFLPYFQQLIINSLL